MTDRDLLFKCLEFLQHNFGEIYKQLLIEQIEDHFDAISQTQGSTNGKQ
jgi:hypothetical protein